MRPASKFRSVFGAKGSTFRGVGFRVSKVSITSCFHYQRSTLFLGPCWIQFYMFVIIKPNKDKEMVMFNIAPTGNQVS